MKIVGLTSHLSGNHDASVALLRDGKIVYAQAEERISRIKHDNHFPASALLEALDFAKLKLNQIDYFVSGAPSIRPLKFIWAYLQGFRYTTWKKIIQWTVARIAIYINGGENYDTKRKPNSIFELKIPQDKIVFVPHYLAHAQTAYSFSGMNNCLVVAWDGYGIDLGGYPLAGTVYIGKDEVLKKMEDIPFHASLALYYGAVTVALGFKLNDGEGKTMGLAVYGKKSPAIAAIRDIFPRFENGKWVSKINWLEINGVSRLDYFRFTPTYRRLRYLVEEYGSEQVAYAAQKVLEQEGMKFFKYLVKKYRYRNVAVAGGLFLNVKLNMVLLKEKVVDNIFIYPNPGDGGIAVGSAIAHYTNTGGQFKNAKLETSSYGKKFSRQEIKSALRKFPAKVKVREMGDGLYKLVAKRISEGKVMGWFEGRDEWGPRALGFRSVMADPRNVETKDRINAKLKERDWFMPFAPVILDDQIDKVLVHGYGTPFMTLTDDVKPAIAKKIPAAIHLDNTARAQILTRQANTPYWKVLNEFYKLTGVPVLLNTSFNKHGLPIVHTPYEAIEHLIWGCVDELVIENFLITLK